MYLFKAKLIKHYQTNTKRVLAYFQVLGGFIFFLSIFRIIILGVGQYPNSWELIPLHFCRFFIMLISVALIFRKLNMIKYVGFFSIIGAIFGLILSDLKNSDFWQGFGGVALGYDSYIFWDFFFIHISSLVIPAYFLTVNRFYYTKRDVSITTISLTSMAILIFFANWALSFSSNRNWNANWFYLAPEAFNGISQLLSKVFGPLTKWPGILFFFIAFGMLLYTLSILGYFWLDRYSIKIDPITRKMRIFKEEESLWSHFKTSRFRLAKKAESSAV